MITDAKLQLLNTMVTQGAGIYESTEDALKELSAVFALSSINFGELEFTSRTVESPEIAGHILLVSPSEMPAGHKDLENFIALCGTGELYNGMFGDASILRDPHATAAISNRTGRPTAPAPVSVQLAVTVRLLDSGREQIPSELVKSLQTHISSILLKYPVLMHPALLMPSFRPDGSQVQSIEYSSVIAALALSPQAGMPRLSHFVEFENSAGVGAPNSVISKSLASFASHPCVILAAEKSAFCVRTAAPSKPGRALDVKVSQETTLRTLVRSFAPRVEFLASIMELDDLRGAKESTAELPFASTIAAGAAPHLRSQLIGLLATSISAASGSIHLLGSAIFSDSLIRHPCDARFLNSVRARIDDIKHADAKECPLASYMTQGAARRVFLTAGENTPNDVIAHNTKCLSYSLVASGIVSDHAEATRFVTRAILGSKRTDARLPRADTTAAIAFLKAILPDACNDDGAVELLNSIQHDINTVPAYQIPFRDDWSRACDVTRTELIMNSVISAINQARTATGSTSSTETSEPVQRRRARSAM